VTNVMRCPYCIQDGNFKVMKRRLEGRWFICEGCSHVVMPENPNFVCQCQKCVEFFRDKRN
jgi:hypothetical protein